MQIVPRAFIKSAIILLLIYAIGDLLFFHFDAASIKNKTAAIGPKKGSVFFNQQFIDGLYSNLDVENPDAVFDFVFSHLDDTVTIYPTENYYYFSFSASGKTIWGNLRLDPVGRDQGVIRLGYFEYNENGKYQDRGGHGKDYSANDGVVVKRLERVVYSVTHRTKTVIFRLNDIGMARPRKAQLRDEEIFVGPVFDESGTKFFLLFDKIEKHFMYILNEDGMVPESFVSIGDDALIGRRTGFAFYQDRKYNRKILVAVDARNVIKNNFYDGPFDQLPDNYVSETNIGRYMVKVDPSLKGIIDKFGNFTDRKDARVAIGPYHTYFSEKELAFVESCKTSKLSEGQFYLCITKSTP